MEKDLAAKVEKEATATTAENQDIEHQNVGQAKAEKELELVHKVSKELKETAAEKDITAKAENQAEKDLKVIAVIV